MAWGQTQDGQAPAQQQPRQQGGQPAPQQQQGGGWGQQAPQGGQPPQQGGYNQQQGGGGGNRQSNLEKVGALWAKQSRNGNNFYSGELTLEDGRKLQLMVFYAKNKKSENSPDLLIMIDPTDPFGENRRRGQ